MANNAESINGSESRSEIKNKMPKADLDFRDKLGLKDTAEFQNRIAQEKAGELVKGVLGQGYDGIPSYEVSIPSYEASIPTYEVYADDLYAEKDKDLKKETKKYTQNSNPIKKTEKSNNS